MIAGDLAVDVRTAALLSSAFTLPYALVQPVLGVTGDLIGKTRLMNACPSSLRSPRLLAQSQ